MEFLDGSLGNPCDVNEVSYLGFNRGYFPGRHNSIRKRKVRFMSSPWSKIGLGLNAEATRCKVLIEFNNLANTCPRRPEYFIYLTWLICVFN